VLIRLYHKTTGSNEKLIFRCQFHTAAVTDSCLSFEKQDLDEAYKDKRFPDDGTVVFIFNESYQPSQQEPGEGMSPPVASSSPLPAATAAAAANAPGDGGSDTARSLLASRHSTGTDASSAMSSRRGSRDVINAMEAAVTQAGSRLSPGRGLSQSGSSSSSLLALRASSSTGTGMGILEAEEEGLVASSGEGEETIGSLEDALSSMSALFFDHLREGETWEARFPPSTDHDGGAAGGAVPINVPVTAAPSAHHWEEREVPSRTQLRRLLRAPSQGGRPGTSPEDEAARAELRERLQTLGSVRRRATPILIKDKLAQYGHPARCHAF